MSQKAVTILVGLMELALMLFTASRTLDLLQQLLPADQAAFAYFGLVAFDVGLLGWTLYFTYGAHGAIQRAITLLMIVVSLLAIGISVIGDLIINASAKGLVTSLDEQQRLAVLIAVAAVIVINVAAFVLAFISEPERLRAMAEESAKDKIHAKTLSLIAQKADMIAPDIAEQLASQWVQEAYAKQGLKLPTQRTALPAPSSAVPLPAAHPDAWTGEVRVPTEAELKAGSEGHAGNGSRPFPKSKSISES